MAYIDNFLGRNNGSGSSIWGSITGNILNQIDLIDYLDNNFYPLTTNPAGYLTSSDLPALQNLQNVCEQGNTFEDLSDIFTLNAGGFLITGSIAGFISLDGNSGFQLSQITGKNIGLTDGTLFIQDVGNNLGKAIIDAENLGVNDELFHLPNKLGIGGTFAMISDLPIPQNLQSVYNNGGEIYPYGEVTSIDGKSTLFDSYIDGFGQYQRHTEFGDAGLDLNITSILLIPNFVELFGERNDNEVNIQSSFTINSGEIIISTANITTTKGTIFRFQSPISNSEILVPTPLLDGDYNLGLSINGNLFDNNGNLNISTTGVTNLTYTASPTNGIVNSDTGTDAILPLSTNTNAGLLSPAEHIQLAGISTTYLPLSGGTMSGAIVQPITPVGAFDLINKTYFDNIITGITWKNAVRAGTTTNITLSGTQTIDGIVLVVGNRVLVKNQILSQNNGIYQVNAGAWTRVVDADSAAEVEASTVLIQNGTTLKNTQWTQSNSINTLGTDPVSYVQISGAGTYTNGTGLTLTGNVFSIGSLQVVNSMINDVAWTKITGTPTTLSGYGITDAYPLTGNPSGFLTTTTGDTRYFPLIGGSITGLAGAGYIGLPSQSVTPSTPATGLMKVFADTTGRLSWITNLGFTRTFRSSTLTADRLYTLQDRNGILADDTDLALKENLITSGTTLQYWRGDKTFQTLNTSVVPESGNLYYTNARTIASTLTGYTIGVGTIVSSDSILGAIQKLAGNINAIADSGTNNFHVKFASGLLVNSLIQDDGTNTGYNITPLYRHHFGLSNGGSGKGLTLEQTSNGTATTSYASIDFRVPTTGLMGQFLATASNYVNAATNLSANSVALYAEATSGQLALAAIGASGFITFNAGGASSATEIMRMLASGNIAIGQTTASSKMVITDTVNANSGSLAGSVLELNQTWNTTGVPTGIKLNVTNTASGAAALLMDLQVGGVSTFKIDKIGATTIKNPLTGISQLTIGGSQTSAASIDASILLTTALGNTLTLDTRRARAPRIYSSSDLSIYASNLFLNETGGKAMFGSTTTPTAIVHITSGSTTAGTGQLKLDASSPLATTEAGSIRNSGTHLFYTATNGGTERQLDQQVIGGTFSQVGTATTTFTVTIGTTMANTNYRVPQPGALNVLSAAPCYITNKTTTTFDVVFLTGLTGTVAFDFVVIP
jgi:hypothetical protein